MSAHPDYLEKLAQLAHADGGWGYRPEQPPHLEPTSLGILALSASERYRSELEKAKHTLAACRQKDGAYRLQRGREQAVWPTSLALFTLCTLEEAQDSIKQTAARLLGIRGRKIEDNDEEDPHDIDTKLIGWPWAEGNFSWAEPTAWACVALRRCGLGRHPRVQEGMKLLLDRTSDDGGINYGNRRILGRITEPIPGPTALMLLALQGQEIHPRIAASVQYLQKAALAADDLEHLCWARIALTVYRHQPGVEESLKKLDERIIAGQESRAQKPWVQPAPLRLALSALALAADERNVFALPEKTQQVAGDIEPLTAVARRPSFGQKVNSWFKGLAVNAVGQLRQLPPQTAVHIAKASDYSGDLAKIVHEQYQHFKEKVSLKGKRVVLKPNLVEYHRDKVINTNPNIVAAAIELCKKEGAAEVIVAEGPGHWRNVEFLVSESGLGDVLREYKVPFVDLNHDEPVKTPNLGRCTGLEHLYLSQTIASADVVISLPKLKTHHWAGATLSLKNLFGTLPGICYGWPKNELHWRGIDNSIVDIALTRTPDLAIVDGIIGMEGDGPLNGVAKPLGGIIMGADLLAVDATCCRLMQLDPEKVAYLVIGAAKKLGLLKSEQIEQIGEKIEGLARPFDTVDHFQHIRSA